VHDVRVETVPDPTIVALRTRLYVLLKPRSAGRIFTPTIMAMRSGSLQVLASATSSWALSRRSATTFGV
jgi:hypothetical protein